jgi:hypothetical protein
MNRTLAYRPLDEAMPQNIRMRELMFGHAVGVGVAVLIVTSTASVAQMVTQGPQDPNQREVLLVRQDASECSGSDVPNVNSPLVGGNVVVTRLGDGTTSVTVAMTVKPNTTYQFFLKCVRPLGNITTDEEGVANVSFAYPTNSVGSTYSFEMHPEGAPPGNRYQSAQVAF